MRELVLFYLLLLVAIGIKLNCDSYVELDQEGLNLDVQQGQPPYAFSVTGLPQGVIQRNNTLVPVSTVAPGQYIVSIKVTDSKGQSDEKIIILNVNNGFPISSAASISNQNLSNSLPASSISSVQGTVNLNDVASDQSTFALSNSSTSSFFGPTAPIVAQANPVVGQSSVSNLQAYFNQISANLSESSSQNQNINQSSQSNLLDILNQYSSGAQNVTDTLSNNNLTVKNSSYTLKSFVNLTVSQSTKQQVELNDAKSKAIFDRQSAAAAYVSSNFTLVQQITANKDFANSLIENITKQYQADQNIQKMVQSQYQDAANNKSSIESAIQNVNSLLSSLNQQLTATNQNITQWNSQKTALQSQNTQTQTKKAGILASIQNLNLQIQQTNAGLTGTLKQCSDLSSLLLESNKNISIVNLQVNLNNQEIQLAQNDVTSKQAAVDTLKKQLAAAEQALNNSQANLQGLEGNSTSLQAQLASLTQNNSLINQNLTSCKQSSSQIQANLQVLQSNTSQALSAQLSQINSQNASETSSILNFANLIAGGINKQNSINSQIKSAQNSLSVLQSALPTAESTLQTLLEKKNEVLSDVQNDEDSLNAAIERYKNETQNLQIATMNLQNARAEQQEADQAVNQLLAEQTNVLPYAVPVSNQNPIIGQTIVGSVINISNWFNFLSANFGQLVSPYSNEDISCLYPIKGLALTSSVPCPSDSNLSSFTAKIVSISGSQLVVSLDADNGAQATLDLPTCANLLSNVQDYSFHVGDSIIVKGEVQEKETVVRSLISLGT